LHLARSALYSYAMAEARRDLPSIELPRSLIFMAAITCGVMVALALQIYLRRLGYDVVGFSQNPQSAKALAPWWSIAGVAFVASGATAWALSRAPLPWRRFRLLRWLAAAAIVLWLAEIDHPTPGAGVPIANPGMQVAANLGVLVLAALMAVFGAYFTVRR
jgi:hypothetical protein